MRSRGSSIASAAVSVSINYETVRRRKDGSLVDISLLVSPIRSLDGKIVGASKIARDISERKRQQEQQALLLREMKHRVKNTIALVQAIASQTIQHSDSLEAFRASFDGRLRALANVQSMLLSSDSEGVPLKTMLENELAPYGPDIRRRCSIPEERDLRLNSEAAQSFQLVLHELVTNANKYGALAQSAQGARLVVDWRLMPAAGAGGASPARPSAGAEAAGGVEEELHFDWIEHPGPKGAGEALSGPPGGTSAERKSGLGLELIRTVVEYEIGGTIAMTLPAAGQTGATCNIVVPWTADGIGYRPREAGAYVTKKQDRPD